MEGGYLGRTSAASIILSADFAADLSGAPVATDSVETAIEKLLGMINFGEEVSFTSVVSAAGTTTLTVNSAARQELTGATTQSYVLPDATTLSVGQTFVFINKSTGLATIKYNDTTTLITAALNTYTIAICTSISTTNGTWILTILPQLSSGLLPSSIGGTGNGFTKFTGPTTSEKTFTLPNASGTIPTAAGNSWTPVPTGLTVVGTPTYEGRYYDVGKIRFITMKISSDTTTASTAGTTYFEGLPVADTVSPSTCAASDTDTNASYGVGRVIDTGGGNMRVMVPTWAATASVTISGFILLL
jgi:hypothetical protein